MHRYSGAPGTPEVTDTTNQISIKWTPPKNDGGSPILGIIIFSTFITFYQINLCTSAKFQFL